MSRRKCGRCGEDPAAGFASINDVFYCHGDEDPEPTCYMQGPLERTAKETAIAIAGGLPFTDAMAVRVARAFLEQDA